MQVVFKYEKDTKNTVRFQEVSDTPIIGTLYIQKSALKEMGYEQNQNIKINISREE